MGGKLSATYTADCSTVERTRNTSRHLLIVGGGQSSRWLLFGIAEHLARAPTLWHGMRITVVDAQQELGTGLAWNRANVLEAHLASRAVSMTRWAFGEKQKVQFNGTVALLQELGVPVRTIAGDEVVELVECDDGYQALLRSGLDLPAQYVVLATGYGTRPWQGKATLLDDPVLHDRPGIHRSPWPAQALQQALFDDSSAAGRRVLLLGSYLTAIDTAVTLAVRAGRFEEQSDGTMLFEAPADFEIVMASRTGSLPKVWGREPVTGWQPVHLTEQRLQALTQTTSAGRFVPLEPALSLLAEELAHAAREIDGRVPALLRRVHRPVRRLRAWRRLLSRQQAATTLRDDIAAVMVSGRPAGGYDDLRVCGWQAPIDKAIALWNECSPWLSAEDAQLFDRELRTIFFNHLLPMTLSSARQIEAMMRSKHLRVVALGRHARLRPARAAQMGFELVLGHAKETLSVTDVVDATGQHWQLDRVASPLLRSLYERGVLQHALRPFRDGERVSREDFDRQGHACTVDGSHLATAGIYVNPRTCEAIPRGTTDNSFSRPSDRGLYAVGPNLGGQFADAQSIGQAQRDARRVVADLVRKQSGG